MDRSVSCNGTGWSSQYLRIGPSVVMVQGGPASIEGEVRQMSWYRVVQPDRRIGPSVAMVQGDPASI